MVAFGAFAADLAPKALAPIENGSFNYIEANHKAVARAKVASRADSATSEKFEYNLAYDPYYAIGGNQAQAGTSYAMAVRIPKETAAAWAGRKITSVNFYTGMNAQTQTNLIKNATVFVATKLGPNQAKTSEAIGEIELPGDPMKLINAPLEKPYVIDGNSDVYFGVIETITRSTDYPIVVDYMGHYDDNGGWAATPYGSQLAWDNIAASYGYVCVSATIEGETMPVNMMSIVDMATSPVVHVGDNISAQFLVMNNGTNVAETMECEVTLGDKAPETLAFTIKGTGTAGMGFNEPGVFSISEMSYDKASAEPIDLKIKITKVNGEANGIEGAEMSTEIQVLPQGKGYKRNVVVEEFTGTWCGWCPSGIVAMEKLRETYTDGSVIPVAIHSQDVMEALSFTPVVQSYCVGYPSAILNRTISSSPQDYNGFVADIESLGTMPALNRVVAHATLHAEKPDSVYVKIRTTTTFVFADSLASEKYTLEYVITEDNVGPYKQTNNYAGGAQGECGGWEKKMSSVNTIYNDVARQLNTWAGIKGSIPAKVEAETDYEFSYNLKLVSGVKDPNHINVAVYLVNLATGQIENASYVRNADIDGIAGFENIVVEGQEAPVEYFNLQGIRVAEPGHGFYIRRQGNKTAKVIL